jgi:RNA polymerase sigma-70 factor, ECF subfamily
MDTRNGECLNDVINLARAGDSQALGWLLEQSRSGLTQLAKSQLGPHLRGKLDPDDLVQDTFLHAHRVFARFRGRSDSEFRIWLREILMSTVAMTVRHYYGTQQRDMRLERSWSQEVRRVLLRLPTPEETPSGVLLRREQTGRVMEALDRLSDGHRQAVVLRHLKGLSFAEIATQMNRSVEAVKKLTTRGLSLLRRRLTDDA